MPAPRPTTEPQQIVAGDTLQFDTSVPNFPATEGWSLSYVLFAPNLATIKDITGSFVTSTGATFNINVPGTTTAKWAPGKYFWQAWVTGSGTYAGQRFRAHSGRIEVIADPTTQSSSYDPRSDAKRNLDALDAVLAGRCTADVQMYRIGGREITKMTVEELLKLRGFWAQKYKAERIANGEVFPSTNVGACFGPVR